ncbi:MAG: D-glycerate dehydrogenase, partial [Proteobacteria bacterium]|nr:D-glycerate dehydrogenase [Pseudomonadota bacterium]
GQRAPAQCELGAGGLRPRLRVVANCAVGVDNIDLRACAARGILVANTPDVLTEATAEFAFLLALAVARRLGEGERLVRSQAWTGWALDQLLGVSLVGATLGIVGMGRIGQALARRARGFGMEVVFAGRTDHAPYERVELDDLFARADVVSLHCPLTPATRHLVDGARLARMKPTAILVNTARGGCVDEEALFEALTAGRLHGAGIDVYAHEPAIDKRFYTCPRLVLAPHIGSATTKTRTAMAQLCVHAVREVLAGRQPANLVGAA